MSKMDHSHLTDRLTAAFLGHADHVDRSLFGEARDEIVRLRAERDELQFEYERADEAAKRLGAKWKAAEADRVRLRDALGRVLSNSYFNNSADILTPLGILRAEVRAALNKGDTL